jgi:hypothetical protein
MRTHEISSPSAAELYFNNSILGYVATLLAESLARARQRPQARRTPPAGRAKRSDAAEGGSKRRGWVERLDAWLWRQEQKQREAYLARSSDVFDLERRIAAIERGTISRYY